MLIGTYNIDKSLFKLHIYEIKPWKKCVTGSLREHGQVLVHTWD
jgi:hypothetical protein